MSGPPAPTRTATPWSTCRPCTGGAGSNSEPMSACRRWPALDHRRRVRVGACAAGRRQPVERAKPTRVESVLPVFFRPEATGAGSHRKETVVSAHSLPHRPSLTNLRKQAKALLVAWRTGDAQAASRVRQQHPRGERLLAEGRPQLADAQLVVAREYGFASWARLVQHLRLEPQAQALHALDRMFHATSGAPATVEEVLEQRVDLLWRAYLDGHPAATALLSRVGITPRTVDGAPSTVDG